MKPIIRVPLKFGVIAGILGAAALISLYYMGFHPALAPIFFDFRIILFSVFLIFTLREYRDIHRGGIMYFGEGMLASFIFVLSYSVPASLALGIFGHLEPEFVSSFVREFTAHLNTWPKEDIERIGKEEFERNLTAIQTTNANNLAWNHFKQSYWIGVFLSIIISVILRRLPKT